MDTRNLRNTNQKSFVGEMYLSLSNMFFGITALSFAIMTTSALLNKTPVLKKWVVLSAEPHTHANEKKQTSACFFVIGNYFSFYKPCNLIAYKNRKPVSSDKLIKENQKFAY